MEGELELAQADWNAYFDAIAAALPPCEVELSMLDDDGPDASPEDLGVLERLRYDRDKDTLQVIAAGASIHGPDVGKHSIEHPTRVAADSKGLPHAIVVHTAAGLHAVLTLRPIVPSPFF